MHVVAESRWELGVALLALVVSVAAFAQSTCSSRDANRVARESATQAEKANAIAQQALTLAREDRALLIGERNVAPSITVWNASAGPTFDSHVEIVEAIHRNFAAVGVENTGDVAIDALRLSIAPVWIRCESANCSHAVEPAPPKDLAVDFAEILPQKQFGILELASYLGRQLVELGRERYRTPQARYVATFAIEIRAKRVGSNAALADNPRKHDHVTIDVVFVPAVLFKDEKIFRDAAPRFSVKGPRDLD